MSEPTLSHDIEEWIKDHSHAAIYASLGRMYATHQLLEDRVARLEELFLEHEDSILLLQEECFKEPIEPRGPHD